jgi:hypothetical protein
MSKTWATNKRRLLMGATNKNSLPSDPFPNTGGDFPNRVGWSVCARTRILVKGKRHKIGIGQLLARPLSHPGQTGQG